MNLDLNTSQSPDKVLVLLGRRGTREADLLERVLNPDLYSRTRLTRYTEDQEEGSQPEFVSRAVRDIHHAIFYLKDGKKKEAAREKLTFILDRIDEIQGMRLFTEPPSPCGDLDTRMRKTFVYLSDDPIGDIVLGYQGRPWWHMPVDIMAMQTLVLSMALQFWGCKKGRIIIENIEEDLDPQSQIEVLPYLKRHFPQIEIVCTTKSPLVCAQLDPKSVMVAEGEGFRQVEEPLKTLAVGDLYHHLLGVQNAIPSGQ